VITLPLLADEPPALVRPVITAPGPREASFGIVAGRVGPGTTRMVVQVNGVTRADVPLTTPFFTYLPAAPFRLRVALPPRDSTIRVIAYDNAGNSAARSVGPVFGLPRAGMPVPLRSEEDPVLTRRIRALVRNYPGPASVFVQDLRSGRGAAWNARARHQAASTLKLGIAVEVLRVLRAKPKPGTRLANLFRNMLVYSSNKAANELEVWLGGSTYAGAARVTATLRALHLNDSNMYGGYIIGTGSTRPIPLRVENQPPYFAFGKYTTARSPSPLLPPRHRRPRSAARPAWALHRRGRALPPLHARARARSWEARPLHRDAAGSLRPAQGRLDHPRAARQCARLLARRSLRRHGFDLELEGGRHLI
jgi:hypothetical protein